METTKYSGRSGRATENHHRPHNTTNNLISMPPEPPRKLAAAANTIPNQFTMHESLDEFHDGQQTNTNHPNPTRLLMRGRSCSPCTCGMSGVNGSGGVNGSTQKKLCQTFEKLACAVSMEASGITSPASCFFADKKRLSGFSSPTYAGRCGSKSCKEKPEISSFGVGG